MGQPNGTYAPQATTTLGISTSLSTNPLTATYVVATGSATSTFGLLSVSTAFDLLGDVITNVKDWFEGRVDGYLSGGEGVTYSQGAIALDFSEFDSGDVQEGANLYFTTDRAREAISETVPGLEYDDSTGVFSISAGHTIPLTASTTEWSTAYGWGDHSLAGYLDGVTATGLEISGTDVALTPGYVIPLTASTTNWHATHLAVAASSSEWSTAFGWGDHADAGYFIKATDDTGDLTGGAKLFFTDDRADARITAQKGEANGLATLDGAGKVPVTQLPNSIMQYQGTWSAASNMPTLADGSGSTGDVYRVSVAGTQNLGSGALTFVVGDYAIYNGATWEKADTTDAVSTVNGLAGDVVLTTGTVAEGGSLYFTDARSRSALSESIIGLDYSTTTGEFSLSSGYGIPLTASTTNWQTFYTTPSNRITAGNHIDWSGNTLNVDVTGDWTGTFDGQQGSYYLDLANLSCTNCLNETEIEDIYVLNSGDSIAGNLTFSGSSANISLGSNYLSGDGGDEGVFVTSAGNVNVGTTTSNNLLAIQKADATAYDSSATDGQSGLGSTFFVGNAQNTQNSFSQILFRQRTSSQAQVRLVASGGNSPFFTIGGGATASANSEWLRVNTLGQLMLGTTTASGTLTVGASSTQQFIVSSVGAISDGTWNADTIADDYGGTGQSTYATGDILYASGANTLSKLGIGSDGECLVVATNVPAWDTCGGGGSVSTSTIRTMFSATSPLAYNSTTGDFSVASGFSIPLTASSTDWQTFFTTPSSRITDGTGLTWSGNTLNVDASQTQITALGTITTGTWNGSIVTVPYGGTGATSLTGLTIGNGSSAITATTTSAGLASVLFDETGTGSAVFSTNPTFAGFSNSGSATLATTTVSRVNLSGALQDSLGSVGTLGMLLQTTATGTRWVATSTLGISGGSATKEFFVQVASRNNTAVAYNQISPEQFSTSVIDTNGNVGFNFYVPNDFTSVTSIVVVMIPDANETVQWDAYTSFASNGQDAGTHSASDLNRTLGVTNGRVTEANVNQGDIATVMGSLVAGDYVGLQFQSDTTELRIVGLRFKYQ